MLLNSQTMCADVCAMGVLKNSATNVLKARHHLGIVSIFVASLFFFHLLDYFSLASAAFRCGCECVSVYLCMWVSLLFFCCSILILPIDTIEYFSSKVSDKSQDIQWNNNRSAFIVRLNNGWKVSMKCGGKGFKPNRRKKKIIHSSVAVVSRWVHWFVCLLFPKYIITNATFSCMHLLLGRTQPNQTEGRRSQHTTIIILLWIINMGIWFWHSLAGQESERWRLTESNARWGEWDG